MVILIQIIVIVKGVKARLESISDFMKSVEVSWNLMKYSDVNWPKSHGVSWSHLKSVGVRFSVEGRWNIMNHLNHLNYLTSTDFKGFEVNWSHLESVEVTWSHLKSDWDFGCFYPLVKMTAPNQLEYDKQWSCLRFGIIHQLLDGDDITFVISISNTDYLLEKERKS